MGIHACLEPQKLPLMHQKPLSFHIILGIIALLPLDFVQRSLSRCDGLRKSAHVEVENFELTNVCELKFFAMIFAGTYVIIEELLINIPVKWRIQLLYHPESIHP